MESGVALRFPPHSKTLRVHKRYCCEHCISSTCGVLECAGKAQRRRRFGLLPEDSPRFVAHHACCRRIQSGLVAHSKTLSRRHRLSTTRVRVPDTLRSPEQCAWDLELLWSLELGIWCFGIVRSLDLGPLVLIHGQLDREAAPLPDGAAHEHPTAVRFDDMFHNG